jgi:FixJ family two-component response regulator
MNKVNTMGQPSYPSDLIGPKSNGRIFRIGCKVARVPRSRLTVGVVEDEAPVRKALGRLLRASGFEVETFTSGREFLDSLGTHRPDCTIVDLHLPGLTGLEVQEHISQQKISLPCIIITGKDEPGVCERALASGAAAYLRKPLDERSLLAAIHSAVPGGEKEGEPTPPTREFLETTTLTTNPPKEQYELNDANHVGMSSRAGTGQTNSGGA